MVRVRPDIKFFVRITSDDDTVPISGLIEKVLGSCKSWLPSDDWQEEV